MTHKFNKNIRVFYAGANESGFSGFMSDVSSSFKTAIDKTDKFAESINVSMSALKAIASAKISNNPKVKLVYDILRTTNAITYDPLELASRFKERDGGKGAKAILDTLNAAEKGEIHVVIYEGGSYQSVNFRKYEDYIEKKPEKIDTTIIDGLAELYMQSGDTNSFTEKTWSNIASYLTSIAWKKHTGINDKSKLFLNELYKKVNITYTAEINKILEPVITRLGNKSPELQKLLEKNNLLGKDGNIDFNEMVRQFKIKDLNEFDIILTKKVDQLKKESEELLKLGNEQLALKANKLTASSLGIENNIYIYGKPQNLDKKNIVNWNLEEINSMIPKISNKLQILEKQLIQETDPKKIEKISQNKIVLRDVLDALTLKKAGLEKGKQSGALNQAQKDQKEITKKNPTATLTDTIDKLSTQGARKRQNTAGDMSLARIELSDTLRNSPKISFDEAQKLYLELDSKSNLTNEEESKKRECFAIIEAHKNIARIEKKAEFELGKDEARKIFIETNQFISGNRQETYDFQALEKIAILTSPESTPGERTLAKMEPGTTVSMQKLMEGGDQVSSYSAPEISKIDVSMNQNGTFNIPFLGESNLTKPQVQEYIADISLYANLGLSQFIPHIPLITEELKRKGINTSIDGKTGTMEQQQVLKEIYSLLFGKKVETTNLGDVERAFSSSVGNPENMKSAMQHVLKTHKLIGESGQSIPADILQKWIRGGTESTKENLDPLKNL